MSEKYYTTEFYSGREGTAHSASILVPILMELMHPKSVIDIGCGPGEFLAEFMRHQVSDVLGVDGDWVTPEVLKIPSEKFRAVDLTKKLNLERKYDLALTFEVAEHLPESVANQFVDTLTGLADVVAFSAAIPHQGGTNHVNEQWPQYWANKFIEKGFMAVDIIRPKIWNNPNVKHWYKQNLILYVEKSKLEASEIPGKSSEEVLPLIHPDLYLFYAKNYKKAARLIPKPVKYLLKKIMFK